MAEALGALNVNPTHPTEFVYVSIYIKCFGLFRIVGDGMAGMMRKLSTTWRLKLRPLGAWLLPWRSPNDRLSEMRKKNPPRLFICGG
ncbi:hypothetical protein CDAR_19701 [Caerostris darwini]|uniref:Uncharacterized protein n=1 Tax=Caerostris darwini TaxID=1538125 RepID=A0AAV4TJG9_9ARAC|nr:hypothetical protein CDAR_19701 [Caerostris darwini]